MDFVYKLLPIFVIKIDPYNCVLYRFKVGAFFETQCIIINNVTRLFVTWN